MVAELRHKQVVSSGCKLGCWYGLLARQPLVCSSTVFVWFPICWCSNVAMEEIATTRSTEIANRIGQVETNKVSERVARLEAEEHVTVQ